MNKDQRITSFTGENAWLSNFYKAPTSYYGIKYPTSENAYQASKCLYEKDRQLFQFCSPKESKDLWKNKICFSLEYWESHKLGIMEEVVMAKFSQNPELRRKLVATGDIHIEEGNKHGDVFWGTVDGKGENHLGRILMKVRDCLK
jgi:ribA/ribD-fused uncharacterized protein